jgi:hypothetical protein
METRGSSLLEGKNDLNALLAFEPIVRLHEIQ